MQKKKVLATVLSVVMAASMAVPSFAAQAENASAVTEDGNITTNPGSTEIEEATLQDASKEDDSVYLGSLNEEEPDLEVKSEDEYQVPDVNPVEPADSIRMLVSIDDPGKLDQYGTVLGNDGDLYLLECDEKDMVSIQDIAEYAEEDIQIGAAGDAEYIAEEFGEEALEAIDPEHIGENDIEINHMTKEENPFTELQRELEKIPQKETQEMVAEDQSATEEQAVTDQGQNTEETNAVPEGKDVSSAAVEADTDESEITEVNDDSKEPFGIFQKESSKRTIALIDSGTNDLDIPAYSVFGNSTGDENGHGSKMLEYIREENKNANIISIRALDSEGIGTISSVYAAIRLAIESDVDIINLSMSARATENNKCIRDIIAEAKAQGIEVVGSAGNDGNVAIAYVPGNVEEAIVVGSAKKGGEKTSFSNYGSTVDCYIVSDSTSEGAARISGLLSKSNSFEDVLSDKRVYEGLGLDEVSQDVVKQEWKEDDKFKAAEWKLVTYNGQVKSGESSVGSYTINGQGAFCTQHGRNSTPTDTWVSSGSCNNTMMRKVLYYGYGAPGASYGASWWGTSTTSSYFWIKTTIALSRANGDYTGSAGGTTQGNYLSYLSTLPNPPEGFTVTLWYPSNSSYQTLATWVWQPYESAVWGQETYTARGSYTKTVTINITKKDFATKQPLSGAKFDIYEGNTKVNSTVATPASGKVSYKRTRTTYTPYYTSAVKWYVVNWSKISPANQAAYTKAGYYSSSSLAYSAAKKEVDDKVNASVASLKKASYSWVIKETQGPANHYISEAQKTVKEDGNTTTLNVEFLDRQQTGDLTIRKINTLNNKSAVEGVEATLEGAQYGLYARNDILKSDNKTILYKKDTLIKTLTIKKNGSEYTASVSGLNPGEYYLKEIKAPKGFRLSTSKFNVSMTGNSTTAKIVKQQDVTDEENWANFDLVKTYGDQELNKIPEPGAVFQILNSKGQVAYNNIITDSNGKAHIDKIPYGSYTLHQVSGAEGYEMSPDLPFTVNETVHAKNISKELFNEEVPEYSRIRLIKSELIDDNETDTYVKNPEEGAVFEVYDDTGRKIQTITTNVNGIATTGDLESEKTYTIKQIKGSYKYRMIDDLEITTPQKIEGERSGFIKTPIVNEYEGEKIRIKKTKTDIRERSTSEPGAIFCVFDIEKAKAINSADEVFGNYPYDISTKSNRRELAEFLAQNGAVITTMTTNARGEAEYLFMPEEYAATRANNPRIDTPYGKDGYAILQYEGTDKFEFQPLIFSKTDAEILEDGYLTVYKYTMDDKFDEYGYVSVEKRMTIDKENTEIERGAEYQIINQDNGEVVSTMRTNWMGIGTSEALGYGKYILHQVAGAEGHELADDVEFEINARNKHETIKFEQVNEEKPVEIRIVKRDKDNPDHLLNRAIFEVKEAETGNTVASMITGLRLNSETGELEEPAELKGTTSTSLKYGTYIIEEVQAPDGYNKVDPITVTINADGVKYDGGDEGYIKIKEDLLMDEPVWGHLTLSKTGELLTGTSQNGNNTRFKFEQAPIAGATYALFAKEDITSPDGEIVYHRANEKIGEGKTNANGEIVFTRLDSKTGDLTEDLYLGRYYVKEISAPEGYVLDEAEHDVTLTTDKKPEKYNIFGPDEEDEPDDLGDAYAVLTNITSVVTEAYTDPAVDKKELTISLNDILGVPSDDGSAVTYGDVLSKFTITDGALTNQASDITAAAPDAKANAAKRTVSDSTYDYGVNLNVTGTPQSRLIENTSTQTVRKQVFDTNGDPVLDDEGNPTYEDVEETVTTYGNIKQIRIYHKAGTSWNSANNFVYEIYDSNDAKRKEGTLSELGTVSLNDLSTPEVNHPEVTKTEKTLLFFRSEENYANGTTGTFTDINGKSYTGKVYSNFEKLNITAETQVPWAADKAQIQAAKVAENQAVRPKRTSYWFKNCTNMTSFDSHNLDTSRTNAMNSMFYNCTNLKDLDLSVMKTNKCTNMGGMFALCTSIESLDLISFDTSSVTKMGSMFRGCSSLKNVNVSSFDTRKVDEMTSMFYECSALTKLDLSNFNTESATDMGWMFIRCKNLKTLEQHFDTSSVTNMESTFKECESLVWLDLTSWDTSSVTSMRAMFHTCPQLKKIYIGNGWNTSSVTDSTGMFTGDTLLPKFDSTKVDKTKANAFDEISGTGGYMALYK